MQLKTILNRVEKHKSFVYGKVRFGRKAGRLALSVSLRPRRGSCPVCSGCGRRGPQYDRLAPRRFEFVPLWGLAVFFVYRMRRVECPRCGVKVERVPWGDGRCHLTKTYRWFLAGWAKRLSWQEVATVFHTSWQSVFRSVRHAVYWGIVHRDWGTINAIGIDEIAWRKGHKYLTLVYQIDEGLKRLLWIGLDRREETLHKFFDWLGAEKADQIRFVCSDMWPAYLKVIGLRAAKAVQILDRFHIASMINKAIDRIRAEEVRELRKNGRKAVLANSRWLFLKRSENLSETQHEKLSELLRINLRVVRAYLLKEGFQRFWSYVSAQWAGKFLDSWCTTVMRSRIEPLKRTAKTLRKHRHLMLNWFRAHGLSAGAVEGLNNKAKVTMRKSYGFRSFRITELALYHSLGALPQPDFTHRFW